MARKKKHEIKLDLVHEYGKESFNQLVYLISALGAVFVFFLLPIYSSPTITGEIAAADVASEFNIISPYELGFVFFILTIAFILLSEVRKKKIEDAITSLQQ